MIPFDRVERELSGVLEELYLGPTPSYRDDLLRLTARTRQRPGWTLPERWLPMDAISQRTVMPSLPWRTIGILALLVFALVAGALFVAGNQRRDLPEPFGLAANGRVAYAADGDIYSVDPVTGESRAIVTGPETDAGPVFSLDGTRIAFLREEGGFGSGRLFVAGVDGSGVRPIIPEPLRDVSEYSFSPDGREVAFVFTGPAVRTLAFAKADGLGVRTLDLGMHVEGPAYRPPDGRELAFSGRPAIDPGVSGVYMAGVDGTGLRTISEPSRAETAANPSWSPDGSTLAYGVYDQTVPQWTTRVHVVSADGSGDRAVPIPEGAGWSSDGVWSNDGKRLVMRVGYSEMDDSDIAVVVVPLNGGPAVEIDRSAIRSGGPRLAWSPDDATILLVPNAKTVPLLADARTGETHVAPWESTSAPAWQRLVP